MLSIPCNLHMHVLHSETLMPCHHRLYTLHSDFLKLLHHNPSGVDLIEKEKNSGKDLEEKTMEIYYISVLQQHTTRYCQIRFNSTPEPSHLPCKFPWENQIVYTPRWLDFGKSSDITLHFALQSGTLIQDI